MSPENDLLRQPLYALPLLIMRCLVLSTDVSDTGALLLRARTEKGLSQQQAADLLGISQGRISQIERDGIESVARLAEYLDALGFALELEAKPVIKRKHPSSNLLFGPRG